MPDEFPHTRIPLIESGFESDRDEAPELPDELIDELLAGAKTPEEITGPGGLLNRLTKRLLERAIEAELSEHLGYERGQAPPGGVGNARNGTTAKTVHTPHGSVRVEQPRDRAGTFEPQIVPKHERRFRGFDERIIAMYARGMSVRDIQAHLAELYGIEVGHDLISRVTDAVLEDVRVWQSRPLEDVYPILFLDALVVKVRDGGAVRNRACYLAIGVNLEGERDVLGLWFQQTEGAKFWLQVLTELKQRGVQDVLLCCVDGLKGFPEAIEAVFPQRRADRSQQQVRQVAPAAATRHDDAGAARLSASPRSAAPRSGYARDLHLPGGHTTALLQRQPHVPRAGRPRRPAATLGLLPAQTARICRPSRYADVFAKCLLSGGERAGIVGIIRGLRGRR